MKWILLSFCLLHLAESTDASQKLVCYYPGYLDIVTPGDVDPFLCTHLIYAFALVKESLIVPPSDAEINKFKDLLSLKLKNPDLKVLLSIQGSLSDVVKQRTIRQRFSKDVVGILTTFGFDGLDINWEYPTPVEKKEFMYLLKAIRQASDADGILLTVSVPAYSHLIRTLFDVPALANLVDSVHVMTYDLHKAEPRNLGVTAFNSPLFAPKNDPSYDSMASAARLWEERGMPKEKIILGIPSYGITYTLMNASNHNFHAPVSGPGLPGKVLYTTGYYSFTESCWLLASGATRVMDPISRSPYMYLNDQWVSFDDVESVTQKSEWIRKKKYGGVMVWNLQLDDVTGACAGATFPLLKAIKNTIAKEKK